LLQCRIIGIIEGEQGRKKERERNDRIVAIEAGDLSGKWLTATVFSPNAPSEDGQREPDRFCCKKHESRIVITKAEL
jgi:hypothetical protein